MKNCFNFFGLKTKPRFQGEFLTEKKLLKAYLEPPHIFSYFAAFEMTADFMHLEDTVGLNVNGTSQMQERMAFTPDIKHVHVQMFTSVCPFRGK